MANPDKGKIEKLLCVLKQERSEKNLRALANAVSGKVKADLYRFKLTREQAEEAYSDCMERLFVRGALEAFDPAKAMAETYIGAIVRNAVFAMLETLSRERSKTTSISAPIAGIEASAPEEYLVSGEIAPDSAVLADEMLRHIRAAVLSIRNEMHRGLYLLYLMSGAALKYEDLGAVFGQKQNNARSIIKRCKQHVAATLEKEFGGIFSALSPGDLEAVKARVSKIETWAGTSASDGLEEIEALGSAGSLTGASSVCGKSRDDISSAVRKLVSGASENLKATVNETPAVKCYVKEKWPAHYGAKDRNMAQSKVGIPEFVEGLGKHALVSRYFRGCIKEEPSDPSGDRKSPLISSAFERKVLSDILKKAR